MANAFYYGILLTSVLTVLQTSSSLAAQRGQLLHHQPAIHDRQSMGTGILNVKQGSVAIIEEFGAFKELAQPGFHWYAPLCISTCRVVDLRTIFVDTAPQEVLTKDVQKITIDGAFHYRVLDPYKAVYHVQDLEGSLVALFSRSVIAAIGQMSSDQAISLKRDEFATEIRSKLNMYIKGTKDDKPQGRHMTSYQRGDDKIIELEEQTTLMSSLSQSSSRYDGEPAFKDKRKNPIELEISNEHTKSQDRSWGIEIVNVAITNITYPPSIVDSMDQQRKAEFRKTTLMINAEADKQQTLTNAEAQKLKIELEAEALKRKSILDAEALARASEIDIDLKLKTARAEAEGKTIRAKGEADAALIQAEADAKAKAMIGSVYQENPLVAQIETLKIASQAMTDAMKSPNSKVFFMNPGDSNNFLTQMLALQNITNPSTPTGTMNDK